MATAKKQPPISPEGRQLAELMDQSQSEFELVFFNNILKRHPNWLEVLRVHAQNLAERKLYLASLEVDRRIITLCPTDSLAHYNLACVYSLLRQPDSAIQTLRKAIELGYRDFRYMHQDRDLDSIRKDPRFRQLLREFETKA